MSQTSEASSIEPSTSETSSLATQTPDTYLNTARLQRALSSSTKASPNSRFLDMFSVKTPHGSHAADDTNFKQHTAQHNGIQKQQKMTDGEMLKQFLSDAADDLQQELMTSVNGHEGCEARTERKVESFVDGLSAADLSRERYGKERVAKEQDREICLQKGVTAQQQYNAAEEKPGQEAIAAEQKFAELKIASKQKFSTYKMETDEIIVQGRIRIAVLESELKSWKEKVQQAKSALLTIVQTVAGSGLPAAVPAQVHVQANGTSANKDDIIKDLQEEVDDLRNQNRSLRANIRRREWDEPQSTNRAQTNVEANFIDLKSADAGRAKVNEWQTTNVDINGTSDTEITNAPQKRAALSFASDPPRYPSSFEITPSGELMSPDGSFNSSSATIANEPMLAPNHSAGVVNVGIFDLEDILGDDFPEPINLLKVSNAVPKPGTNGAAFEEDERSIDEQLRDHDLAMQKFQNVPKPGILKTGAGLNGGSRGQNYEVKEGNGYNTAENDYGAPRNCSNMGRMHGRYQNYNRFGSMPNGGGNDSRAMVKLSPEEEELLQRGFDPNMWNSVEERNSAVDTWRRSADRREQHFPEFFKNSLVYVPSDTDNNYLRTVHIGNLPSETELRDVLSRVRGGQVLKAILLNTMKLTGGMSAMITFVKEGEADEFVEYTGIHPLTFGDDDEKTTAEVALIATPTYPMSAALVNKLNHHGSTRCLLLPDFPHDFSPTRLERNISGGNKFRAESLVEMYFTPDKSLHLEFSSIDAAGSAFAILTKWQTYHGLRVIYAPDTCAGPVEQLQLDVGPRKPLFPKDGFTDGSAATHDAYADKSYENDPHDPTIPRRQLAVLDNQKVSIPDCSGRNLISTPWADDTDDEDEADLSVKPTPSTNTHNEADGPISTQNLQDLSAALKLDGLNQKMAADDKTWETCLGLQRPITGLAGSKYATQLPAFEDKPVEKEIVTCGGTFGLEMEETKCMMHEKEVVTAMARGDGEMLERVIEGDVEARGVRNEVVDEKGMGMEGEKNPDEIELEVEEIVGW